jgi:polyhydroxyalkanoate synthesis regulator phasin
MKGITATSRGTIQMPSGEITVEEARRALADCERQQRNWRGTVAAKSYGRRITALRAAIARATGEQPR